MHIHIHQYTTSKRFVTSIEIAVRNNYNETSEPFPLSSILSCCRPLDERNIIYKRFGGPSFSVGRARSG